MGENSVPGNEFRTRYSQQSPSGSATVLAVLLYRLHVNVRSGAVWHKNLYFSSYKSFHLTFLVLAHVDWSTKSSSGCFFSSISLFSVIFRDVCCLSTDNCLQHSDRSWAITWIYLRSIRKYRFNKKRISDRCVEISEECSVICWKTNWKKRIFLIYNFRVFLNWLLIWIFFAIIIGCISPYRKAEKQKWEICRKQTLLETRAQLETKWFKYFLSQWSCGTPCYRNRQPLLTNLHSDWLRSVTDKLLCKFVSSKS